MDNIFSARVEALRALMARKGWDAVVITGSDPHSSEYPAFRWKQVQWLSGFTGEAGDIVVTADHAGLWTDTRYFIQANSQLAGTGIVLHKTRVPDQVLIPEWLASHAFKDREGCVVAAVDGLCQRVSAIDGLCKAFEAEGRSRNAEDENSYKIASVPDLLETLWEDRPAIPATPVITLGKDLTGESRLERLAWLRDSIGEKDCDAILLTSLDEIAWVLNVRGSDIEYNPYVISYLLVTQDGADWFVRKNTFESPDEDTLESFAELENDGVRVLPYDDVAFALAGQMEDGLIKKLAVDPSTLNYDLYGILRANSGSSALCETESPVALRKSVKTAREIEGMREAHIEDGVAVEKFLYWLEAAVQDGADGGKCITEWDAAVKLAELRSEIDGYRGDSFETISAYGKGAALPHYITPHDNAPELEPHGLYLCDSGGQYLFGTTDITRTVPLGECTELEKEDYTLVLKGHIDLSKAVFPRGTAGCQMDILARNPLWQARRNYGHGTGHGVGFFLGVHEGPQEFRQNFNKVPFAPGMITSVEPGIYREGMHGVRHESLVLCVEDGRNEFGDWLRFETITLCHIDTSIIVKELLDADEIRWLNDYNAMVCETLCPRLPSEVAEWLKAKCEPV